MHSPRPAPTLHRIPPGQDCLLSLDMGSELFCRQGELRLHCPQLGQAMVLRPGQGWRAAEDLWLHLGTRGPQTATIELQATWRPQKSRSTPEGWTERLWGAGLRRLRRGLRAASWRTL